MSIPGAGETAENVRRWGAWWPYRHSELLAISANTSTDGPLILLVFFFLLHPQAAYDVLAHHSRALDRADVVLMKTVYWPEGIDNHGVFNGNAAEFAEFIAREIQN